MIMDLDFKDIDFKEKIINTEKGIKIININGDIKDINYICDILEDVKENIQINTIYKNDIDNEFKRRNTYQGFNRSILNRVNKICQENISKDDYVVDMTVGNGNDTLFLAKLAKKVFGFDIQKIAIDNTSKLLKNNNIYNYELICKSHDKIDEYLKDYKHNIKLILFNLGYLPHGDKSIVTKHETTLKAVKNALDMLNTKGLILIVFYPHKEGKIEAKVVLNYLDSNKLNYKIYKNTTNENAPFLVVIKKDYYL